MIYSFDPGDTTGVAWGSEGGDVYGTEQLKVGELYKFLHQVETANKFIIEDFHIMPRKAASFAWSDMKTIQIIGALKYDAYLKGIEVVMQRPPVKTSGYRWAGLVPPKNHDISHSMDAYAHLVYHWVHTLKLEAPVIKQMRLNNG